VTLTVDVVLCFPSPTRWRRRAAALVMSEPTFNHAGHSVLAMISRRGTARAGRHERSATSLQQTPSALPGSTKGVHCWTID